MATHPDRVERSVTHFEPGPPPLNPEDLGQYVITELKRLGDILLNQVIFRLEVTHEAPSRPRTGDIRFADGTNWDPGSGQGIYFANTADPPVWTKL